MLSKEENELLTRVCGDAPMGRMIRQHWWMPGCAVSENLVADGKRRCGCKLFGRNQYVAFRATHGRLGFFDEACPHRGASHGPRRAMRTTALRCIYHGWKFSVEGVTVAVPTQPNNEAEYCKHVPLEHYPVQRGAAASSGCSWARAIEPPELPAAAFHRPAAPRTWWCSGKRSTPTGCRRWRRRWIRPTWACCTRAGSRASATSRTVVGQHGAGLPRAAGAVSASAMPPCGR